MSDDTDHAAYLRVVMDDERLTAIRDLDIDAFADGVVAHRGDLAFHQNPHKEFASLKRLSWSIGWNERALKALP